MKHRAMRLAAVSCALLLLFLVFAPSILHMFHEHSPGGRSCPFCMAIVENNIMQKRLMSLVVWALLIKLLHMLSKLLISRPERRACISPSLISEYVRMNN